MVVFVGVVSNYRLQEILPRNRAGAMSRNPAQVRKVVVQLQLIKAKGRLQPSM